MELFSLKRMFNYIFMQKAIVKKKRYKLLKTDLKIKKLRLDENLLYNKAWFLDKKPTYDKQNLLKIPVTYILRSATSKLSKPEIFTPNIFEQVILNPNN